LLKELGLYRQPLPDPQTPKNRTHTAEELVEALKLVHDLKQERTGKSRHGNDARRSTIRNLKHVINADGSLKASEERLAEMEGYPENRQALREAFERLGYRNTAQRLPEPDVQTVRNKMTADTLAHALRRQADDPTMPPPHVSRDVGDSSNLLRRYIHSGRRGLSQQGRALVRLPDYAERRDSIEASLRAMGQHEQADKLPVGRVSAEDFLSTLRGHRTQVAEAIERMRSDPGLSPRDAAREVGMPREAFSIAIEPGAKIRDPKSVKEQLENVNAKSWLETALNDEIERLNALARGEQVDDGHMTAVKYTKGTERLFIVEAEETKLNSRNRLKSLYDHPQNRRFVQSPRPYGEDRPRQMLRWMSTVLRERFPTGREVQSYFDADDKRLYVSSNRLEDNGSIRDALVDGAGLEGMADNRNVENPKPRETRHWRKLRHKLSKPPAHDEDERVTQILEAIKQRRFEIPDQKFTEGGKTVHLHAERRIDKALGRRMNLELLAGTRRACAQCAAALRFEDERRRGPFWLTGNASAFLDRAGIVENNKRKSIGTYVTRTNDGGLTADYNTDSDSDTGPDFPVAGPSRAAAQADELAQTQGESPPSPLTSLSSAESDDGAGSEVEGHSPAAVSSPGVDNRDEVDDFLYATVAEVDARRGGASVGSRSLDVTMADRPATEDSDVEMADTEPQPSHRSHTSADRMPQ
jgi:hypothetical protein